MHSDWRPFWPKTRAGHDPGPVTRFLNGGGDLSCPAVGGPGHAVSGWKGLREGCAGGRSATR